MRTGWLLALALMAAGCGAYRWSGEVPGELRTVSVPVFRNESDVTELGSVAARELAREFQREGTFRLSARDEAALEIQGEITGITRGNTAFGDRFTHRRRSEYDFSMQVKVSVIDRRAGKVLVDARKYTARTTFVAEQDLLTAERDASGRLAEDLARQVVDDLVGGRLLAPAAQAEAEVKDE